MAGQIYLEGCYVGYTYYPPEHPGDSYHVSPNLSPQPHQTFITNKKSEEKFTPSYFTTSFSPKDASGFYAYISALS